MPPGSSLAPVARVGTHLIVLFVTMGAVLPFLPVWLAQEKGLSGGEIGLLLALISFTRVLSGPLLAAWSQDHSGTHVQMQALAAASVVLVVLYALAGPPWLVIVAGVLFGVAFQSQLPLADAETMAVAEPVPRIHYAQVRALASLAFVGASLVVGHLIERFGAWAGWGWMAAGVALALASSFLLPLRPVSRPSGAPLTGFGPRLGKAMRVFQTPGLMRVVIAASLLQCAHGFYYGFSSNLWLAQGIGPDVVSALWSVGVVAEVAFLMFVAPRLDRVQPRHLLLLAALLSLVRWGGLALAPPLPVTFALQTLHAASFAMVLVATLRFVQTRVPPHQTGDAQQLSSSLVFAPMMGAAILGGGFLAEAFGTAGYWASAGLAAAGLAVLLVRRRRSGPGGPGGD